MGLGEREEIRVSRRRDWEGRRVRSLSERKDCAASVTRETKAATFWLFRCFALLALGPFFAFRFFAMPDCC